MCNAIVVTELSAETLCRSRTHILSEIKMNMRKSAEICKESPVITAFFPRNDSIPHYFHTNYPFFVNLCFTETKVWRGHLCLCFSMCIPLINYWVLLMIVLKFTITFRSSLFSLWCSSEKNFLDQSFHATWETCIWLSLQILRKWAIDAVVQM